MFCGFITVRSLFGNSSNSRKRSQIKQKLKRKWDYRYEWLRFYAAEQCYGSKRARCRALEDQWRGSNKRFVGLHAVVKFTTLKTRQSTIAGFASVPMSENHLSAYARSRIPWATLCRKTTLSTRPEVHIQKEIRKPWKRCRKEQPKFYQHWKICLVLKVCQIPSLHYRRIRGKLIGAQK